MKNAPRHLPGTDMPERASDVAQWKSVPQSGGRSLVRVQLFDGTITNYRCNLLFNRRQRWTCFVNRLGRRKSYKEHHG